MNKWDGLNRRRFPRVNYPCLVILREDEPNNVILSHTENISVGGVCVILKQNLKMFSEVDIEIDLLDLGSHLRCRGKIVWNVQRKDDIRKKPLFYDIGIEFQDMDEASQKRLDGIVQRLRKNQKPASF